MVQAGSLPANTIQVTLIQSTGAPALPADQAFWLLPGLAAPNEGVQVLTASARGSVASAPSPRCTVTATSHLDTYDNNRANLRVWYSRFELCGEIVNGSFDWFMWQLYAESTSPFRNRSLSAASGQFTSATTTSATGTGESHFVGVFPLVACLSEVSCMSITDWQGHAYHQTTLNLTDHQTWLRGQIDANVCTTSPLVDPELQCSWNVWKAQQFYAGETFANDGSIQPASWTILQIL